MRNIQIAAWRRVSRILGALLILAPAVSFAESPRRDAAYEHLDLQAVRVTTEFRDARAISERLFSGSLATRLLSSEGRPLVQIHAGLDGRGRIEVPGKALPLPRRKEALDAYRTADDSNLAAYAVWNDGGSSDFDPREIERDVISVRTEFHDYDAVTRIHPEAGADPKLPSFTTALFDSATGELVGRLAWYAEPGLLVWEFRDGRRGSVSPDTLGKDWPFRPGPGWANLQIFGLHSAGAPAENAAKSGTEEVADERGCDRLHWLDNTILRPCCDRHDLCYRAVQPACTARSWYYWRGNWSCVQCNAEVVFCFLAGTARAWWEQAFYWGVVDWGSDGYVDCGITLGNVCPAWCRSCLGR